MQRSQESAGTVTMEPEERKEENVPFTIVRLKPKPKKKVVFTEDTIDNETMNKLKSNSNDPCSQGVLI